MSSANIIIAALVSALVVVIFGMTTLCAKDAHQKGGAVWQQPRSDNKSTPPPPPEPKLDLGPLKTVTLADLEEEINTLKTAQFFTLVFYSPRCPWCVKMVDTLKELNEKADVVGEKILLLEANQELSKAEGQMKELLQFVKGLPTVFKVSRTTSEEIKAAFFSGYGTPDQFAERMSSAPSINLKL